jgi:hypothetical protein
MRMKRIVLFSYCLSFSIFLSAQKLHFTDRSNVWQQLYVNLTGPAPVLYYSTYNFIRDSVVGLRQYQLFNFYTTYHGYAGTLVREDTLSKMIYVIDPYNDSEVVLMNYNLAVGDTFNTYCYPVSGQYIVAGIDSTYINATWHKVWHFSRNVGAGFSPWSDVIEGIGCIQTPMFMLGDIGIPGEYYFYVYCYSNSGSVPTISPPVRWLDNNTSCITFPRLLETANSESKSFSLFPNPVSQELTINTGGFAHATVAFTNMMGQTVKTVRIDRQTEIIDVRDIMPGTYRVTVSNEIGIQLHKQISIVR